MPLTSPVVDAPPGHSAAAAAIAYAEFVGPMLWLWIFGLATEVVVLEVVLQSIDATWVEAVRPPFLGRGSGGLLQMLGVVY